jgi:hypothetical protein
MQPSLSQKPRLNPIIVDAPQRSREWFKGRLGKVTGSKAEVVMSYKKPTKAQMAEADLLYSDRPEENTAIIAKLRELYPIEYCLRAGVELPPNTDRTTYKRNLVAERLTGMESEPDMFTSYAMKWGTINEPLALALYQLKSRSIIAPAPLLLHPTLACGASPDSLVTDPATGLLGNVEVKCLETRNHLYEVIVLGKMPKKYIPQVQMQMWTNGRDFCDFVAYDSRLPDGLKIFIIRVERDDFYIDEVLEPAVRRLLDEVDNDFKRFWAQLTDKGRVEAKLVSPEYAS